ncbi:MAG TPA: tetratricopeptide repeat protein [Candidatus Nanoarchaeia archaeon]|nr:tetratricopeptide repeat protein [Candidatus Nanoarchaeia archaeon]
MANKRDNQLGVEVSPKISLCMIAKNEEALLGQCLRSVQELVDEIILVDTGSTDKTKEIASTFGAKVYDFTWCDDFAAARNESLKYATGDWILILDADEVLEPEDGQKIKEAVNEGGVAGFRMLTRNYSNDSSLSGWQPVLNDPFAKSVQGWYPSLKVRLFQRQESLAFQGKIHELIDEQALLKRGKVLTLSVPVHHYGAETSRPKTEKYLAITQKKVAEDSHNAKAHYELGIQYKQLGEFALAENSLARAVELDQTAITPLLNLALVQQKQGKIDEAIFTFQRVLEKKPQSAEAHFGLGFCYFKCDNLQKAAQYFSLAVHYNPLFLDAYTNLGAVYEKLGEYDGAQFALKKALELNPKSARVYYNLGVVHEKQAELEAAIRCYEQAIALQYVRKDELKEKVAFLKQVLGDASKR